MSEKIHLTVQEQARLPEIDHQNVIRYCPKCGREIPLDRQLCAFCGNNGRFSRHELPKRKKALLIFLIMAVFLVLFLITLFMTRNTGLRSVVRTADPLGRGTPVPVSIIP